MQMKSGMSAQLSNSVLPIDPKQDLGDRQKSFYHWEVCSRKGILLDNELGPADSGSPSALGAATHAI